MYILLLVMSIMPCLMTETKRKTKQQVNSQMKQLSTVMAGWSYYYKMEILTTRFKSSELPFPLFNNTDKLDLELVNIPMFSTGKITTLRGEGNNQSVNSQAPVQPQLNWDVFQWQH